jgi:diguanylate cyclase (GGDEF)-like protein
VLGSVIAYQRLDGQFAARLRSRSGLATDDVVAIIRRGRIVASSPQVRGLVGLRPGVPGSISVGGVGYRGVASSPLGEREQIALLSPSSLIDAANASTRRRLLLFFFSMLVVVGAAAYIEGRAIVKTLRALVAAVNRFAGGRTGERVPARGRDEFAQLGRAFNEMAGQLETRLDELSAERERLAAAVKRIGETFAATHDPDELLRVLLQTTLEATGASSAILLNGGDELRLGEPGEADERLQLPLSTHERSFGTVVLWAPHFTAEQRQTASSLAAQAAVALDNARLHSIVEQQALVDGLTGLANRRRCEDALATELARAKRFGTTLSIVVADLDDLKAINDRYGHVVGDTVLRVFAEVMRYTVRDVDLAGRWGGEEFILLLPGTRAEGAVEVAERVRTRLEERTLRTPGGETLTSTASFGVASFPPLDTPSALFEAADEALYQAKAAGKNRVAHDAGS